jgi:hypothetical protein
MIALGSSMVNANVKADLSRRGGLAEQPQRRGEHAGGDPAQRPGVHVREHDLVAEVHEVGAVEDPDDDGPDEHDHRHLEQEDHLTAQRVTFDAHP